MDQSVSNQNLCPQSPSPSLQSLHPFLSFPPVCLSVSFVLRLLNGRLSSPSRLPFPHLPPLFSPFPIVCIRIRSSTVALPLCEILSVHVSIVSVVQRGSVGYWAPPIAARMASWEHLTGPGLLSLRDTSDSSPTDKFLALIQNPFKSQVSYPSSLINSIAFCSPLRGHIR